MWVNQITKSEWRTIVKEILKDYGFSQHITNLLQWEHNMNQDIDGLFYKATLQLLEDHNLYIGDVLSMEESLCESWRKAPIEVLLSMYYKSLHPSLDINDFSMDEEIKTDLDKINITDNPSHRYHWAHRIKKKIETLALEKSWVLNALKRQFWNYREKNHVNNLLCEDSYIASMISLHEWDALENILENNFYYEIIKRLKKDTLSDMITFSLLWWLDIVKNNNSLADTVKRSEIKTLIKLQEKWILRLVKDLNLSALVNIKGLEHIRKSQILTAPKITCKKLETILLNEEIGQIEF